MGIFDGQSDSTGDSNDDNSNNGKSNNGKSSDRRPLLPRRRGRSQLNLVRIVFFLHLISLLACGALAIHATKSTVEHRKLLESLPPGLNYVLLSSMVLFPVAMLFALNMLGRKSQHERFKLLAAEAGMSAMQLFFFYNAFRIG